MRVNNDFSIRFFLELCSGISICRLVHIINCELYSGWSDKGYRVTSAPLRQISFLKGPLANISMCNCNKKKQKEIKM